MTNFVDLGLSFHTLSALQDISFTEPTEIQEKAIPLILDGRDIMASAQTGSGKTAAFALPIIECLQDPEPLPRALVLVPTRELALQVEKQFKLFSKYYKLRSVTLYGGTGFDKQVRALKKGVDVIVATPGRLLDCVQRKLAVLSDVEILVLDEADRLLDMGFMPQVTRIISKLRKDRATLLFSATIDYRVQQIASTYMNAPETIRVNEKQIEPSEIDQSLHYVHEFKKDQLLAKLIKENKMHSVLVFTKTKRKATWVKDRLRDADVDAEELHGDITQNQREKTLARYRDKKFPVLVATDVAARGLDIPSISHVINYDLPESPEDYVHRIGRTGRAGRVGTAMSFVSTEQRHLVGDIEKVIGKPLDPNRKKKTPGRKLRLRPLRTG